MIKTFRGLAADGDIVRIKLSTNNGLIGYKIKKLQVIPNTPAASNGSFIMQFFSVKPSAASATINFDNPTLKGVALYITSTASNDLYQTSEIIDETVLNQDVYVTVVDGIGSEAANYYVELEQVKLDTHEAAVATLKDMRGSE